MRPLQFITVIIKPCLQHDSVARVYWRQHFSFTVRRTTIAECVCVCAGRYAPTGNTQSGSVPTDPFMVLVTPDVRFANSAAVAPASFCSDQNVSGLIMCPIHLEKLRYGPQQRHCMGGVRGVGVA